jgi:hypothetical protein
MNIAICLSGGLKYPEIALESIKNIFPNDQIKIFIHTWKVKDKEKFIQSIHGSENKEIDKQISDNFSILEEYNYESLLIENYETKEKQFEEILSHLSFLNPDEEQKPSIRNDVGPISMHYSVHKSNELKKQYEKENNMIFDVVFRMRFDNDFRGAKFDVTNIQKGIWVPWMPTLDFVGGLSDIFALGTSHCMDIYSSLFLHLHKLQKITVYHPEIMLRDYLKMKGMPVNRFSMYVQINNGNDWKKNIFYYTNPHIDGLTTPCINMRQDDLIVTL